MPVPGLAALTRAMLAPRSIADMLRAMLALRGAQRDMAQSPTGALLPLSPADSAADATVVPPPAGAVQDARRWVDALRRAERYGPWRGACLMRSMALHRLLDDAGIEGSTVRVGVRTDSAFEAHAWVELHGVVIGDRPAVKKHFQTLGASSPTTEPARAPELAIIQERTA